MRNTNKPTKRQLKTLYQVAGDFKKAEPWKYLYDADLICVENPTDKMIGYCSVMGKSGQHFALGVFLGDRGFYGFNYLMEKGDTMPHHQAVFYQDCLMCSFEDQEFLDKRDRTEIKGLGLAFSGRNAWPQFRRFEPGYFPWYINQEECSFLTHALRQTLITAEQYRQGAINLDFEQGRTLLRYSQEKDGRLVWHTKEFQLNIPEIEYLPVEFRDDLLLQRLHRTSRRENVILQAETCYLPMPVQGENGERPYFPRAFVLTEEKSGMIVDYNMYEAPQNDAHEVLTRMASVFLEKGIPKEIQVKPGKMVAILQDFCQKAGVNLRVVEDLSTIDDFIAELTERF